MCVDVSQLTDIMTTGLLVTFGVLAVVCALRAFFPSLQGTDEAEDEEILETLECPRCKKQIKLDAQKEFSQNSLTHEADKATRKV